MPYIEWELFSSVTFITLELHGVLETVAVACSEVAKQPHFETFLSIAAVGSGLKPFGLYTCECALVCCTK